MARFNRRGIAAAKRIHHRTAGTRVAVRPWAAITNHGRHAPNSKERQVSTRPIRRKERSFNDEIYQHGPFVTIYCRLRRYPVGGAQCAHRQRKIIRFVGEHSDSLRAAYGGCSLDAHCGGCVRPYGSAGADEFTNGVPRSYLRALSLAALPQQSESTTGRAGTHVAVRPWAAIARPGRHTPNPKGRTDCLIAKSTCTGYL